MKHSISSLYKSIILSILLGAFLFQQPSIAQEKQRYSDVKEALSQSGQLSGSNGPRNVSWIDNGNRYSYMQLKRGD